jgi:ribosomal protein S8
MRFESLSSSFLLSLKKNLKSNELCITVKKSKKLKKILYLLIAEGYLNYFFEYNNYYKIYINFTAINKPAFTDISKSRQKNIKLYIKKNQLNSFKFFTKRGVFIINSSVGLLTHTTANIKKIGGQVFGHIY